MLSWTSVNDWVAPKHKPQRFTPVLPTTAPHWVAGVLSLVNPLAAVCGLPSALAPPLSTVIGVLFAADFPLSLGGQQ